MMQIKKKGFTLVEILVVVALIAILATITFVAINPGKNFQDTRNAQRSSHIGEILDAVTQYTSEQGNSSDDFGTIPVCSATPACIGTDTTGDGCIDLDALLVDEYIVGIPEDPTAGSGDGTNTGYTICKPDATSTRIQIAAPNAEGDGINPVKR